MNIEIIKQKENPLLERVEVEGIIHHPNEPIPSRDSVRAKLAAMLNKSEDQVVIQKIEGQFGLQQTKLRAHVYESKEDALKKEPKYLLKRNKLLIEE